MTNDLDNTISDEITKCHNCDSCIPIGQRNKPCRISDGRFDTKEKCCHTRVNGGECPAKLRVLRRTKQCETCIRNGLRDCMYHGYPYDTIPVSCEYKIGVAAVDTVYDVPVVTHKRHP
jgi:hypothetical protein